MAETRSEQNSISKGPGKVVSVIASVLFVVLVTAAVFAFRFISWLFHNFGGINVSSIIYTLSASTEGKNPALVTGAVVYVIPWAVGAFLIAIVLMIVLARKRLASRIVRNIGIWGSIAVLIGLVIYTAVKIDVVGYVKSETTTSAFIDDNYVDPGTAAITFPEKKRNLIFLFVESMEISFSDPEHGGGKPVDVIPELTEIAFEGEMFSGNEKLLNGGYSLHGATYTMGGIFAQTAGLPLNSSVSDLSLSEGFLPGITTMGDILEREGYHNVFCIGTDASFADRDKYFKSHGDYDIYDFEYSLKTGEIPEDYNRSWWGYDDFILYENAKKHLTELAASDEPFNFTMLTVDTHAEDGYICDLCDDRFGEDQYSNAMACASRQAAEFIRWIQEQDFYENTTVVVTGDHCTMDSDYGNDIVKDYRRRIYDVFLNADAKVQNESYREFSSMDIFPTTLAALGATIRGERLGLGTNLYSAVPTFTEQYGKKDLNEKLAAKTDFFDNALGEKSSRSFEASYDDETGYIHIIVDKDIQYDGEFSHLICDVSLDGTKVTQRNRLKETENGYEAYMNLPFCNYVPGKYNLKVSLMLKDGLPYWYATESLELDEVNFEYVPPLNVELDEDGHTLVINYMPPPYLTYEEYWFPTWSDHNATSDLKWYKAEKQADGSFEYRVDLNEHTASDNVTIHIYGGNDGNAAEMLDNTTYIRESGEEE